MDKKISDRATQKEWLEFLEKFFLFSGGAFISLGVMFFIAYNWNELGKFFKFGLVEFSIVACVAGYFFTNQNSLFSKLSLLTSSFLVGVLLALFGQTYQLQADSWTLFFYWGVLVTPWAILSRYAIVFLLVVILFNISLYLYTNAYHYNFLHILIFNTTTLTILLFLLNALSYAFMEYIQKRFKLFEDNWEKKVLLILIAISVINLVINLDNITGFFIGAVVFGFGLWYFFPKKDLFSLGVLYFSLWLYSMIWLGKILTKFASFFTFIIPMAALSIFLATFLLNKLKQTHMEIEDAKKA